MAPPCFGDLGKQARDLLSKTLDAGKWKVEVKSKTESGTKFKATTVNNTEKSVTQSGLETEFAWPDYGLKFVEKWNTDNQLSAEVNIEDQFVKGSKVSFESSYNPSTNKRGAVIKTTYKNDYLNSGCDVELDYVGPVIKSATVVGYKGWLAGYQLAFKPPKTQLVANNFALSYTGGDYVISGSCNNMQEFGGSYYHKVTPEIEMALCGSYTSGTSPAASAAAKYSLSPDTSVKAKVATSGTLSLSLQQKVFDGVSMTLSSAIDAKNFHAGGHKVGLAIEVDQ